MRAPLVCGICAAVIALWWPSAAHAESLASTYARIKGSLALVVAPSGRQFSSGTAFCIQSNSKHSYFITNAHVVGKSKEVAIVVEGNNRAAIGTIVRRNSALDVAIIEVPLPDVPSVSISMEAPAEGTKIAVAGYPASQLAMANQGMGLSPSVHEGSVSALPMRGLFIEYDAHSEHGNSGSPVFNAASGVVYGMETYGYASSGAVNVAIAFSPLAIFLENSHIKLAMAEASVPGDAQPIPESNARSSCLQAWGAMRASMVPWVENFKSVIADHERAVSDMQGADFHDKNAVLAETRHFEQIKADTTYAADFIEPAIFRARDALQAAPKSETTDWGINTLNVMLSLDYYEGRLADEGVALYQAAYLHERPPTANPQVSLQVGVAARELFLAIKTPIQRPCEDY